MAKPKRPENANELVARAKTGDRTARDELLAYGAKFLHWYATQPKLRAPTRPSDVGGNATLNMVKSFQDFEGVTIASFEGWLVTIVTNEAMGSVRQKVRRKTKAPALAIEEEIAGEQNQHTQKSPSAKMGRREDYEELYIAISYLPKTQREAVYLKVVEGQSVPDIADQLGKTQTAVEGLIQRGIEGVRKQLAPGSNGVARRMTSAERQLIRTALSDYLQKLDMGEDVDIEVFVASRAPENESLRLLLEWARRIRKVGGKSGVGGSES
ncbi:MAG TPA: sigma-70 family RNA polymerase sigma factor [Polyangium sp.]|nr:sigma-70 family RNA polymerase sigma factor [Polyangium sp.]